MESATNRFWLALAGLAPSATAFWFGTGLSPLWWLAWLAALPLLLVAPRLPRWLAFAVAAGAFALGGLNLWHYQSFLPLPIHMLLVIVPACVFGLGIVLFRACFRRGALWQAGLALPSFWIAFEYLLSVSWPHGTFGALAYSQMNFLPAIQIASLAGIASVSFCPLLFSSLLAVLFAGPGWTTGRAVFTGAAATFLVAVIGFGVWRLQSDPSSPGISVGLIASDRPENLWARTGDASLRVFRRYLDRVPPLAAQGARIVVMPEDLGAYIDPSLNGNAAAVDAMFSDAARRNRVYIVVGIDHAITRKLIYNQARIYSPDGKLAATYDKRHLLPGFESVFTPGLADTFVDTPMGTVGVAICKDLDFPPLGRSYAHGGAALLLVPALDFQEDGWLHSRMAILRSVESGFSMVRAANEGVLTLSDDRGRVLAERASDSAPFATLVGKVPLRHEVTLYSRFGDWFAWLDLVLFGFVVLTGLWRASRQPKPVDP